MYSKNTMSTVYHFAVLNKNNYMKLPSFFIYIVPVEIVSKSH